MAQVSGIGENGGWFFATLNIQPAYNTPRYLTLFFFHSLSNTHSVTPIHSQKKQRRYILEAYMQERSFLV